MKSKKLWLAWVLVVFGGARGATVSPLGAAGYSVLPQPQKVALGEREFQIGASWRIQADATVAQNSIALEALNDGLAARHAIHLNPGQKEAGTISLSIRAGTVDIDVAQDVDKEAIARQAYRLNIGCQGISIQANADEGLFYGVETLIQLIKHRDGQCWLRPAIIEDWPDLPFRAIYWDDAHHLEKMDVFKQVLRQAAFYKINAFILKLDGHFQYASAPAMVEPYALSPNEYQELTDYALRYHIQLVPYIDAPGHMAFLLKHPEYAPLRAFADSNYEMNTLNPESWKLLFGMFQDLLDANKGGKYFFLSTDEAYYMGMSDDPKFSEVARAKEVGGPGKLLAEFVTKAAGYAHERGRTVFFWGEHPMKPADVPACPPWMINGLTHGGEFDAAFKAHGIRSTAYLSLAGSERLFPDYAVTAPDRMLHPRERMKEKVEALIGLARSEPLRKNNLLTGTIVAGWADMGLHPETFWLGYGAINAAGWNPRDTERNQAAADFYRLFYGPSAQNMDRIYRLLSTQAQFYADSWEIERTKFRSPTWGNSRGRFEPRRPGPEHGLPLPKVPQGETFGADEEWSKANARRLELAEKNLCENDELIGLLHDNLARVEFNAYNIEVFLSVVKLCRQNLEFLKQLERMNASFGAAQVAAKAGNHAQVLAELDKAIDLVKEAKRGREEMLKDATETWYKSWLPRVAEANGRKFRHELDDVKDHLPDRTVGMEYLVYRQMILPMGKWVGEILAARNGYAKGHGGKEREERFEW